MNTIWTGLPEDVFFAHILPACTLEQRMAFGHIQKIAPQVLADFEAMHARIPKIKCDPGHAFMDEATYVLLEVSRGTKVYYINDARDIDLIDKDYPDDGIFVQRYIDQYADVLTYQDMYKKRKDQGILFNTPIYFEM